MKKIIIAMFALCCFAVLPATARQVGNINLDLDQKAIDNIQSVVNPQDLGKHVSDILALNTTHALYLGGLKARATETGNKSYENLLKAYEELIKVTQSDSLDKNTVNQDVFTALDDLAKALNALPAKEKVRQETYFAYSFFYFRYANKVVNISALYHNYASIYYSDVLANSPIIDVPLVSDTLEGFIEKLKETKKGNKESTKVQEEQEKETSSSGSWECIYWTVKGLQKTK